MQFGSTKPQYHLHLFRPASDEHQHSMPENYCLTYILLNICAKLHNLNYAHIHVFQPALNSFFQCPFNEHMHTQKCGK